MPPAARQGDVTVHGGTIVAGDPTVLINGMPAARQGDMHLCPMCTGTVPHVGGPVAIGASTVLINGMPAARVGDVCTCTGPPDTIAAGEPTVQVRSGGNPVMVGGGGHVMIGGSGPVMIGGGTASGDGGGESGAGRQGAVVSALAADATSPEETNKEEHWLEFRFEDGAGNVVGGVPYELEDPEGETTTGWLHGGGLLREGNLSAGRGTARVKQLSGAEWSTDEARPGDEVTVSATAKGIDDGTRATVQIKEVPVESISASVVEEIETDVRGEEVEVAWTFTYEDVEGASRDTTGSEGGILPGYVAEVRIDGYPLSSVTGVLTCKDDLRIQLRRKTDGEALAGRQYRLKFSNGEVRTGTSDRNGWIEEKDVPPGTYRFV